MEAANILVIEDDDNVRSVICQLLTVKGFNVDEAPDGGDGIAKARQDLPGLILCDIKMPDVDGYGVLASLREDERTFAIPIIMLTGMSSQEAMRQGMELGADDYITKPFKTPELLAAIDSRLKRAAAMKQRTEEKVNDLRGKISHLLPHELRTPLQGIMGFADIMAEDYKDLPREDIGELARGLQKSARRLHELTEGLLLYAQLETMCADPEQRAAQAQIVTRTPAATIQRVAEEIARQEGREDDLALELDDASVYISQEHLEKVAYELIGNAFKFSNSGTPVAVFGHSEGGEMVLQFYNEGRGMTPEQISNIGAYMQFERERFEQQGAGIGLAIIRLLVELHGGSFDIASVPDKETTVHVALRRRKSQPSDS